MRFLLDLQVLQAESRDRGIGRYSRGLAQGILDGPQGGDASVLLNWTVTQGLSDRHKAMPGRIKSKRAAPNYWHEFERLQQWIAARGVTGRTHVFRDLASIAGMMAPPMERIAASEAIYDAYVDSVGTDIVHIASPFEGFGDDTAVGWSETTPNGPARAATIYDLIPFEAPEIHLAQQVRERWYRRRFEGLSKADVLLSISAHTREVAIALLGIAPDRVVNIAADTDPIFRKTELSPSARTSLLQRYGVTKPFVMHVGILEGRKNVPVLIEAFAQLPPDVRDAHQLLLIADATAEQIGHLRGIARKHRLDPDRLLFPGFAPDEDLVGLYGLSSALVMPSLAEGFGLPVLEAMRCGAPVLAADATSLPEVVGNRDLLFPPRQPAVLAEKLARLLVDKDFRRSALDHGAVQERRFSWAASASLACQSFAEAVARRATERGALNGERPRYVLVPHLDIGKDGAARIDELANALKARADVSMTAPQAHAIHRLTGADYRGVEPSDLQTSEGDRVVIVADDGAPDLYQGAVMAKLPAVVVLPRRTTSVAVTSAAAYRVSGYRALLDAAHSSTVKVKIDPAAQFDKPHLGAVSGPDAADVAAQLEKLYAHHPSARVLRLLPQLKELHPADRADAATAIAENHPILPPLPRLLVDISELVHRDAKSGIQRVVRSILKQLLSGDHGYRVEPIYREGDNYRYARRFTLSFLNIPSVTLKDALVEFYPNDTFLGLDLDLHITERAAESLRRLRYAGGSVNFVMYDLLPLLRPECFPVNLISAFEGWLRRIASTATRIVAISRTVADEIPPVLAQKNVARAQPLELSWYHNGCDDDEPSLDGLARNLDDESADAIFRIGGRPMFLTVGTIEPRKGIAQLLDAAEVVWRDLDATFVLVGKEGWMVGELVSRIKEHPEFGKRLFWFGQVSDELLSRLYRSATAVVLPSEGEGFGLPLIEAAARHTPVIARSIPVFHEVGDEGVAFFDAANGDHLAPVIKASLAKSEKGPQPQSKEVRVAGWAAATGQLLDAVKGRRPHRAWP